jgi:hypothetical protein
MKSPDTLYVLWLIMLLRTGKLTHTELFEKEPEVWFPEPVALHVNVILKGQFF